MDTQIRTVHNPLHNPFASLSGDCISEILSRTSPLDASRFAVISKGCKSAADSDIVWERFIPAEIVSRSVSPVVHHDTKKSLYLNLCSRPILLDGGKLSFFLDKRSGKNCFMIGARELIISWGDTQPYWKWTTDHANSRFSEVAHLNSVSWLDIRGKINTRVLSQKTTYSAYLVFQLANIVFGLESVFAVVRLVNHESDGDAEDRAGLLHLHRGNPTYRSSLPRQTGRLPVWRTDGWLEIKMGEFYNDGGDDGEVEARLLEIWRLHGKSGLIVEGIEFRPEIALDHRQLMYRA